MAKKVIDRAKSLEAQKTRKLSQWQITMGVCLKKGLDMMDASWAFWNIVPYDVVYVQDDEDLEQLIKDNKTMIEKGGARWSKSQKTKDREKAELRQENNEEAENRQKERQKEKKTPAVKITKQPKPKNNRSRRVNQEPDNASDDDSDRDLQK